MLNRYLRSQIKAINTKKNGQLKKLKNPKAWLFPLSAQRKYTAELYVYVAHIASAINQFIAPIVPSLLLESTLDNPEPVREDDFIDRLNNALARIKIYLNPFQEKVIQQSKVIGLQTAIFNHNQFNNSMSYSLGVDIFLEEPWLDDQLKLFANQNAQLITSLTNNEIERVAGIVQRGMQEGSTNKYIEENLKKSLGITQRHAKLIARDQTTKLNGSLTKLRQQEADIEIYIWQTGADERVRSSHKALEGKYCSWQDPTIYKDTPNGKWKKRSSIGGTLVHTSVDINCRCVPIPYVAGILESL